MRAFADKKACVSFLLMILLLSVFSYPTKGAQASQNYVLIFFSDMNLDPAPVLYTKGEDATITSTGYFRIDNLKNFNQINVHLHYDIRYNMVGATFIIIIKVNGNTLVNYLETPSSYGPTQEYDTAVGVGLLKEGINTIEVTLIIKGIASVFQESSLTLLTDSYFYISSEEYSPRFVVTTDISEYLTKLRIEQINMRQRIEEMNSTLTQVETQLQNVQNQTKTLNSINGLMFLLLIINLSLLVYLIAKRR